MHKSLFTAGLTAVLFAVSVAATGCAADSTSESATSSDAQELKSMGLAIAAGAKVPIGETSTIRYALDTIGYKLTTGLVPYMAFEIVKPAAPYASGGLATQNGNLRLQATHHVSVKGPFPGTPRVLVVNQDMRVIARADVEKQPDGTAIAVANVALPDAGPSFIVVRDSLWSKPMEFEINVGELAAPDLVQPEL